MKLFYGAALCATLCAGGATAVTVHETADSALTTTSVVVVPGVSVNLTVNYTLPTAVHFDPDGLLYVNIPFATPVVFDSVKIPYLWEINKGYVFNRPNHVIGEYETYALATYTEARLGPDNFSYVVAGVNETIAFGSYFDYDAALTIPAGAVTLNLAAPEPASWALLLVGFGVLGGALRGDRARSRVVVRAASSR